MEKVSLSNFASGKDVKYGSIKEVEQAFEAVYRKYFPESSFEIAVRKFLGNPRIVIYSGLFQYDKDLKDQSVTVRKSNNPVALVFYIREADKTPVIKSEEEFLTRDNLTMVVNDPGLGFYTKPPKGSNLAMKWYKISYRKPKGNIDKIIKAYDRYMSKLYEELKKNKDKIYAGHDDRYNKLVDKYIK